MSNVLVFDSYTPPFGLTQDVPSDVLVFDSEPTPYVAQETALYLLVFDNDATVQVEESLGDVIVFDGAPVAPEVIHRELGRDFLVITGGGPPGPQGPPGVSGTGFTHLAEIHAAGEDISGQRAIVLINGLWYYADPTNPLHLDLHVFMSENAALTGDQITGLAQGPYDEVSWTWTPEGRLFLGLNGTITQTAPTGVAFVRVLGSASSATSIYYNPRPPIVKAA